MNQVEPSLDPLVAEIDALEAAAAPLAENQALDAGRCQAVFTHAAQLLRHKAERPVFSRDEEGRCEAIRQVGIRERGLPLERALELLRDTVEQFGVQVGRGGTMAYIPGSENQLGALGAYLAAVANPYTGVADMNPGAVVMQETLLRWLADSIGFPATSYGDLTSGGSIANLSAVVTAREAYGIRAEEVATHVVYCSTHTHHSVTKALHIAGLAECPLREIPCDQRSRMDCEQLRRAVASDRAAGLRPWLIVGCAGTTDTGSVDELSTLADISAEAGCWLHVDAAYGGSFALCAAGRAVLRGIERADSVTLDPHKGLFSQGGIGAVLVRDGERLCRAFRFSGSYLRDISELISPADVSPELTRPFRALPLWLPLAVLGVAPYRAALAHKLALARHAHARLQRIPGLWVGPEPQLSILVFRCEEGGDAANETIARTFNDDGEYFISTTVLEGRVTLRMALLAPTTSRALVDRFIDRLAVLVDERFIIGRAAVADQATAQQL